MNKQDQAIQINSQIIHNYIFHSVVSLFVMVHFAFHLQIQIHNHFKYNFWFRYGFHMLPFSKHHIISNFLLILQPFLYLFCVIKFTPYHVIPWVISLTSRHHTLSSATQQVIQIFQAGPPGVECLRFALLPPHLVNGVEAKVRPFSHN